MRRLNDTIMVCITQFVQIGQPYSFTCLFFPTLATPYSSTAPEASTASNPITSIPNIDYDELSLATNNWSDSHILGKGGFGKVFKGQWKNTTVAIKRIEYHGNGQTQVINKQSEAELKFLNSCRHDNILPLYGYSRNGGTPCLVYQFMPGGTLEDKLAKTKTKLFPMFERLQIATGVARFVW